MAKKRNHDFTVYSNSDIPKKKKEKEVSYKLDIPNEDTFTGLYVTSPYFLDLMMEPEYFYYPIDVESEESLIAPILNPEVLYDFLSNTETFRCREEIPAFALLFIAVEDEDGEEDMASVVEDFLQESILKFFRTTAAILNPDVALEEDFDDIFQGLLDRAVKSGYMDRVLQNIVEYVSDPEVMEAVLFPEEEE